MVFPVKFWEWIFGDFLGGFWLEWCLARILAVGILVSKSSAKMEKFFVDFDDSEWRFKAPRSRLESDKKNTRIQNPMRIHGTGILTYQFTIKHQPNVSKCIPYKDPNCGIYGFFRGLQTHQLSGTKIEILTHAFEVGQNMVLLKSNRSTQKEVFFNAINWVVHLLSQLIATTDILSQRLFFRHGNV